MAINITNISRYAIDNIKQNNRLMDRYEIKMLFGVIMGALCVITTLGNILVIYKYRKASMVGNLFIISLAVADLIVGAFVMPLATIYAITEVWTMTLPVCQIWLSADYTASTASILNLFTLSLDRYWSITSPLAYLGKRTRSRALIMISIAWSISLLWLAPITGWAYVFNNGIRYVPEDKCNTEYDKNIVFKVATAICNFYLPLIAMIAINTKIYLVIHKRYRNPIMRYSSISPNHHQNSTNNNNINNINKKYQTINQDNISNGNANSLKIKINNYDLNNNINQTNVKKYQNKPLKTNADSFDIDDSKLNEVNADFFNNNLKKSNKLKSFSSSSVEFFDSSNEQKLFSRFKFNFSLFTSNSGSNVNSYSAPNLKFIKNDLTKMNDDSTDQINCNKLLTIQKKPNDEFKPNYRSVISKIRENRRIPSDSIKMSRLVYRDSSIYVPNDKENIERASPLFFHGSIESNLNLENKNDDKKKEKINDKSNELNNTTKEPFLNGTTKKGKKISIDKAQLSISESKMNRKGFMNKQEKAFKQLSAIVIGFTLCFLPYFIVFLIVAICENCVSDEVFTVTLWLGYFNSTMNPFLYALSNKKLNKKKRKKSNSGDNNHFNSNKSFNFNNNKNNNNNNQNQIHHHNNNHNPATSYINNRKNFW